MPSKHYSQNQVSQQTADRRERLIGKLKDYLEDMCGEYLKKGKLKKNNRSSNQWGKLVKGYGDIEVGHDNREFSAVEGDIYSKFACIAEHFVYNKSQERPLDFNGKWTTWRDIEDQIKKIIPNVFSDGKKIIEELHSKVYLPHYRKQQKIFNGFFVGNTIDENTYKSEYKDDDTIENQIKNIKKNDNPRNSNIFDRSVERWVIVIDETGDFGENDSKEESGENESKKKFSKVVAVHIPLKNKNGDVQMHSFCSRTSRCKYPNCPGDCLKNWHAVDEKYQEVDRVVRLASSKERGKETGCVVIGIEVQNSDDPNWAECVESLIRISASLLTEGGSKTGIQLAYRIECRGMYKNSKTGQGKVLVDKIKKTLHQSLGISCDVQIKDKSCELVSLADAAASAWRPKTVSIINRTKWEKRGLQTKKFLDYLQTLNLGNTTSGEIPVIKICKAFEKDVNKLGIDDVSHTGESDPKTDKADLPYTHFLEGELNLLVSFLRKQGKLASSKEIVEKVIRSEAANDISPLVLEHVSEWIRSLGD